MDTQTIQANQAGSISADVQENNSGQIAVGNYNLQIGAIYGGVVNINVRQPAPLTRPRETPAQLRPRRFDALLDRQMEVSTIPQELLQGIAVELQGSEGAGKTSLLRYFAHAPAASDFPDGIVYLTARSQPLEDLLQSLYDVFYETITPHKPSEGQIRIALSEKRALILLDDVGQSRGDVQALMDVAPRCAFILASAARHLWDGGRVYPLSDLPVEDALHLFERELGRSLNDPEKEAARSICLTLEGWPLYILRAAAVAREGKQSLEDMAAWLVARSPFDQLEQAGLSSMNKKEKRLVAALAAFGTTPISGKHLPALTGVANPFADLSNLIRRGIVTAQEDGFRLTGRLAGLVDQNGARDGWRASALDYFKRWLAAHPTNTPANAEVIEPVTHLLESALRAGQEAQVIELARLVEPVMVLNGRWGAWGRSLHLALRAAEKLEDLPARAWALHQIGTRAMCLGDLAGARSHLIKALRLRRFLRDRAGAAVTRHNLNILLAPPPPPRDPPRNTIPPTGGKPLLVRWLLPRLLALGLISGALAPVVLARPIPERPAIPIATPSAVAQLTVPVPALSPSPFAPDLAPSPTLTDRPASSPSPAQSASVTPTATSTGTPIPSTGTPLPPILTCVPDTTWPVYIVEPADTLSAIARWTGSTVLELKRANCRFGDTIFPGEALRVPRPPLKPAPSGPSITLVTQDPSITPITPTTAVPFPDLLVTQLELASPPTLTASNTVFALTIQVTVRNDGNASAEGFDVELRYTTTSNQDFQGAAIIIHPIVGKLVEVAGEAAADEFRRRFNLSKKD